MRLFLLEKFLYNKYMNKTLVEESKKKLLEERQRLQTVLGHQGDLEGKGEFPGDYKPKFSEVGREDGENASEVEQFANDLAVTEELEDKLMNVEAALKKIENGTYGTCEMGDQIEEDRLRAVPEARLCMKHAQS
jgi:RNA polymerase-binding transcription factor DksA